MSKQSATLTPESAILAILIQPRFLPVVIAANLLTGCAPIPESYPPPIQRRPLPDVEPSPVGAVVSMNDPNADAYFLRDVSKVLEGGAWRWTYARPELRFFIEHPERPARFVIDFTIVHATFATTGPVTISFFINERLFDKAVCAEPGDRHYEKQVPRGWLKKGFNNVAAEPDKVWISDTDGAKLGFTLRRIGFEQ